MTSHTNSSNDPCLYILQQLHEACRRKKLDDYRSTWEEGQFLREVYFRYRSGHRSAWRMLMVRLSREADLAWSVREILLSLTILQEEEEPQTVERRDSASGGRELQKERLLRLYPDENDARRVQLATRPPDLRPMPIECEELILAVLNIWHPKWRSCYRTDDEHSLRVVRGLQSDDRPKQNQKSRQGAIKYIEQKPGLAGHARIGRVQYSKSRSTIYYRGRTLRSLNGSGYKANYIDVDSRLEYWISNCKRNGDDTLYGGLIEIDEDAREEYWTEIRKQPENAHLTQFRSLGKYSKR